MRGRHAVPGAVRTVLVMPPHTEAAAALTGPERVIVAPAAGVFEPATRNGTSIRRGQVVGHVVCGAERVEVTSPFDGQARGVLPGLMNEFAVSSQSSGWLVFAEQPDAPNLLWPGPGVGFLLLGQLTGAGGAEFWEFFL